MSPRLTINIFINCRVNFNPFKQLVTTTKTIASRRGKLLRMERQSCSRKAVGNTRKDVTSRLASATKRNDPSCSAAATLTCAIIIWRTWHQKRLRLSFLPRERALNPTQSWKTPPFGSASRQLLLCFSSSWSFSSFPVEQRQKPNPKLHR